jgi:hypothetical protein
MHPAPRSALRRFGFSGLAGLAFALLCGACGEAADPAVEAGAEAAGEPARASDLSGVYQVFGSTVDKQTGDTRELFGTVVLRQTEDRFTTSFELKTEYPVEGGSLDADVIGEGSGRVEAGKLDGHTRTQLVLGTVPGVDTGFAFMPRSVGPRIESRTQGSLLPDGTLEFVSENEAASEGGQGYRPTRTTLRATRIGDPDEADEAMGGDEPGPQDEE